MTRTLIEIGGITVNAADFELPLERTFRESWSFSDNPEAGVVVVDMDLAKDIWRDKIREKRKPELEALDTQFMKAMETGADTTEIVAKKQALRDAPAHPDIDAATTPEELKAVQPISGVIVE